MAFSPKHLTFFLLTTLFIISTQARESHFFSKVTRHPDPTTTTTTAATTNENDEFSSLNKQNEEVVDPTFTPETSSEAGYGLYGHETGLFPPSTATKNNNNNNNVFENPDGFFPKKYETENKNYVPTFTPETSSEASYGLYSHETGLFPPSTTTTTTNRNTNNINNNNNNKVFENPDEFFPKKYETENKNYVPELKGLSEFSNNNENTKNNEREGVGYYGGVQKQGMSDTRFLENGMYYYDVNSEKTNNNKNNNNINKGGNYNNYGGNYMPYNTNYGGNYKENEYYGGNNNEFYNRNGYFNGNNAMQGGYMQNQKTFDDEFEFDP